MCEKNIKYNLTEHQLYLIKKNLSFYREEGYVGKCYLQIENIREPFTDSILYVEVLNSSAYFRYSKYDFKNEIDLMLFVIEMSFSVLFNTRLIIRARDLKEYRGNLDKLLEV